MKAPVGLLSDRTVLRSKMEGPRPDKFTLTRLDFCGNLSQQFNITYLFEFQLGSRRSRSKFLTFYRYITNPNQGHPGRGGQVQVVVWRFFIAKSSTAP